MSEQKDQDYYRAWMSHRTVSRRGLFRGLLGAGKQAQLQVAQETVQRAAGGRGKSFSGIMYSMWELRGRMSLRFN